MSAQQPSLGPEINEQGQDCSADLAQDGLLTFLGYHVGTFGKSERARQEILRRAFSFSKKPKINPGSFESEWGKAESAARLSKIAETIAFRCRNAKLERGVPKKAAIHAWESDLAWLRQTFCGYFKEKLAWPSTDIATNDHTGDLFEEADIAEKIILLPGLRGQMFLPGLSHESQNSKPDANHLLHGRRRAHRHFARMR